ncbi:MAG: hypothetical protein MPJ50_10935 [Pirellulales bacterium]|nr:hypothetical protein [Pirellulales bacterium]
MTENFHPRSVFTRPTAVGVFALVALSAGIGAGFLVRSINAQSFADKREIIESMPAEEKAALQEKRKRFAELQDHEKEQLTKVHQFIAESPERDRLSATMFAYYDWVKGLDYYERRGLRESDLSVAARIQRVNAVRLEQVKLTFDDVVYLAQWLRRVILSHVDNIDASEYERSLDRTLALAFIKWINHGSPTIPEPTLEDYEALAGRLGIQHAFKTEGVDEDDQKLDRREFVANQIYLYLFNQRGRRGRSRAYIDHDELMEFFASDRMPAEAKARIINFDRTRQHRELAHFFLMDRNPNWWKNVSGGRGRGGRREGDRDDGGRRDGNRGGGRGRGGRPQRPGSDDQLEFSPFEGLSENVFKDGNI